MRKTMRTMMVTAATTTVIVSVMTSPVSASVTFKDVGGQYNEAVQFLVSKGVQGVTSSTFGIHDQIKRVDAAVILAKVLDLPLKNGEKSSFSDVPKRATAYVNALTEAGITQGKTASTFDSNSSITRGELAIWIQRAFQLEGRSPLTFTDVSFNYETAVQALASNGITSGISETQYGTHQFTKRGDFAVLVYKAYQTLAPIDDPFTLSIMHTNDTHAHLDEVAKRVTAVKEVRASKPDALLVDAGDVFSGTLYFNEFQGKADLEFLNLMQYDVMTLGNHEFDLGSSKEGHKALSEFIKAASFPVVSSNINFSQDSYLAPLFREEIASEANGGEIYTGIIKEVNGEKIGFFGLTTEETKEISSPGQVTLSNYVEAAEKTVQQFEQLGVNKIVAVTHIGYDDNPAIDNDITLAKAVEGIDVIVGGHSHTQLDEPVVIEQDEKGDKKDPTVIVQAYQYNDYLGTVDVKFDDEGKVIGQAGQLIKLSEKTADLQALEQLKPYTEKINQVKNTSSGAVAKQLLETPRDGGDETKPSVRKNETPLGNLITDAMLSKAKEFNPHTVIAMQNGGGIRASIAEGDITFGDILTVLPFGNTLATVELTGAEIVEALEHSVRVAPAESGGFLHVSGLKFTYDTSKEAGNRVQKVEVKGNDGAFSELDQNKAYIVATNAFTAKGGDGFTVLQKAYEEGRVTDLGLSDWENLRDYVKTLGTVDPQLEGRIIDLASSGK